MAEGLMPILGRVYFIGAGPGDPGLLTLRAHTLLRDANIVLHDDLVPPAIVLLAGPQAMILNVGKRCGAKKITQMQIHRLMIASTRRGMNVVRLKSGDPGIFGRMAEEIDALVEARVPYEVVPGVTAGVAAAASLGVSLTDRRTSSRIVIISGHRADESAAEVDPDWARLAGQDATLLIYMPGKDYAQLARELMAAGFSADLPCIVVSKVSTLEQSEIRTTLIEFQTHAALDSPAILLIGRVLERAIQGHVLNSLDEITKHNLSETNWNDWTERRIER
jgi:uroporphyrin-III C-methyltransferase